MPNRPLRRRTFPARNASSPTQLSRAPTSLRKPDHAVPNDAALWQSREERAQVSFSLLHAVVLWIWPRALQALFKIFWLDASLRQGDACRLPIAARPRTATFSHRPARNTYLKLVWLLRF